MPPLLQVLLRLANESAICSPGDKSGRGEGLISFDHRHCSSVNIPFTPTLGISPARGLEHQQRPSEAVPGNDLLSGRHGLLPAQYRCASAAGISSTAPISAGVVMPDPSSF